MRIVTIAAALAATAGMILPLSAAGQSICGAHENFTTRLKQEFREHRRVEAVTTAGALMEVYISESGSWTVLVTLPGGPSCLVASGEGWQALPPPGSGA